MRFSFTPELSSPIRNYPPFSPPECPASRGRSRMSTTQICITHLLSKGTVYHHIQCSLQDSRSQQFQQQISQKCLHSIVDESTPQSWLFALKPIFPYDVKVALINKKVTIIESRVIPGRTKSYKAGVITLFLFVFLSVTTKKMLELPTSPTFPFHSHKTCWWPDFAALLPTAIVGP